MHLVDAERSAYLYDRMPADKRQISGGSAANTAAGVASLGGRAAFVGKVADDDLGDVFADDLHRIGVHYGDQPPLGWSGHGALDDPALGRRRAHDEHLSRRLPPADRSRHQGRRDRRRDHHLHGRLPVGPGRRPRRPSSAPPTTPTSTSAATSFTLSDPFCVNRYRDEFLDLMRSQDHRLRLRQRRRAEVAVPDRQPRTDAVQRDRQGCGTRCHHHGRRWRHGGAQRRDHHRAGLSRSPKWSMRPAPAISSRRGSCSRSPAGANFETALKSGCLAASEVISPYRRPAGARPAGSWQWRTASRSRRPRHRQPGRLPGASAQR